jgi:hypothetical protein
LVSRKKQLFSHFLPLLLQVKIYLSFALANNQKRQIIQQEIQKHLMLWLLRMGRAMPQLLFLHYELFLSV